MLSRRAVSVEDDGVGMPERGEVQGKGLGWTLVDAFVRQLGANLTLHRERGTHVALSFAGAGKGRRNGGRHDAGPRRTAGDGMEAAR
jgi:two-component sensor histidine kinase